MRLDDSHKGDNGIVLVVGGSKDLVGAVYLAAKSIAIMRTGTDLVFVASPEKVAWTINKMSPDLIAVKLDGEYLKESHYSQLKNYIDRADVILIGNGASLEEDTKKLVQKLVKIKKPKIIDADALKAIDLKEVSNAVFTPHEKEFDVLLKNSELNKKNFQKKLKDNILLLKGKTDNIYSKDKVVENITGNAGMTVGGTGDVLSGLIAGFASQGRSLFDSAKLSAKIIGEIGDDLEKELGFGYLASDFLKEIAEYVKKNNL